MKPTRFPAAVVAAVFGGAVYFTLLAATPPQSAQKLVADRMAAEYPSLFDIYQNLHKHPELSFMEVKTAALVE